jgi:hypothetical protein
MSTRAGNVRTRIWSRIAVAVLATAVAGSLALPARADQPDTAVPMKAGASAAAGVRALASDRALRSHFGTDHGLFTETFPNTGDNAYSYEWPFSQAMIGAIDLAGIRSHRGASVGLAKKRIAALDAYWNPEPAQGPAHYASYVVAPLGGGGDAFYDDNEWDALAFLQWYAQTGNRKALKKAEHIFDLVVYGWDDDPSHACPGGVFWTQAPWSQDRNTVSNGPGAEVGAHLYLITGKRKYLTWAKKMVAWTDQCLLAPNGLYYDNIKLDGSIDKTQWSYNQGVMLGAKNLLYRATGQKHYLREAQAIADASLDYYGAIQPDGQTRYFTQPARFNAILFTNFLQLGATASDPAYVTAMKTYEKQARQRYLDKTTGLYRFDGSTAPVTLLEQAAMVRIQSMLAWSPKDWSKLT